MQIQTEAPIVVDLDGTLTPSDTLVESLLRLIKQSPFNLLRAFVWLTQGRAGFKQNVARRVTLAVDRLPYRAELIDYLRREKARGRALYLATAAHASIADAVGEHLQLFDAVLATQAGDNLKGEAKLDAIVSRIGKDFVYAGDAKADLPIWRAARAAILVGVAPALAARVRATTPVEREFPRGVASAADWGRALRVHQWIKNLLLFVPMLTAFSFVEAGSLALMGVAFLAFSLAASASYLVNDLWDLDSDRVHPSKRLRPLASASITIPRGLAAAAACLFAALALAQLVSTAFLLMVVVYLMLTCTYSWLLKSYFVVDVLTLSILYTLRLLAGALAIGVAASSWLLAFSVFVFFSLALVKRCAELVALAECGVEVTPGRDYRVADLCVLWPLGVSAALAAIVVFGLYISAAEIERRYASPQLLWGVAIGLIYWLARLWIKTARGEMHHDPVVFAIRDAASRATVGAMLALTVAAHFWTPGA